MSLLNLTIDNINKSMVAGLKAQFKSELYDVLIEVAKKEINEIIEHCSKHLELAIKEDRSFRTEDRHIKLDWFINLEQIAK